MMEVTIDRISNRGNPIAEEKKDGQHIHVYGAEKAGETLDVELYDLWGIQVGIINNPSKEQCERAGDQMPSRVAYADSKFAIDYYNLPEKTDDLDEPDSATWGKIISEDERKAAKDNSASLDDIAEKSGGTVRHKQENQYPRETDDEEPDSNLAKDTSSRHD